MFCALHVDRDRASLRIMVIFRTWDFTVKSMEFKVKGVMMMMMTVIILIRLFIIYVLTLQHQDQL
jgi:hypothetical protein